ncbi:hypothetical protein B566_EDAN016332 [Ephemera danica]|nr:hypothetical protein B566_EDAN016332 [Ephemera danica]
MRYLSLGRNAIVVVVCTAGVAAITQSGRPSPVRDPSVLVVRPDRALTYLSTDRVRQNILRHTKEHRSLLIDVGGWTRGCLVALAKQHHGHMHQLRRQFDAFLLQR